jgi:hypothetical protein
MSLLKKECGNCYWNSVKVCVLVVVLIPDYSKLDKEIARLEQQENNVDVVEVAALEALLAARAKKDYLQKQRKLLVRCEQQ